MAEVWESGADFVTLPATITFTSGSAVNWTKHTPPRAATAVDIRNNASAAAYVSIGHTLTEGSAAATDAAKAWTLAEGESYCLDLVGIDAQALSGAVRDFYTAGANLSLLFLVR